MTKAVPNATGHWTAATVLMIGAENGCLKFATGDEGGSGIQWCANTAGTKLVRKFFVAAMGIYLLALGGESVQSIIGASLRPLSARSRRLIAAAPASSGRLLRHDFED
ncbi:hypothetical protein [Pseudomonas sp. P108]|uniref:hypothetical protein n=1 Tax=Pseudomonas sp. P108 TaxID=1837993 RepID=UPI00293442BA|nr:hypothetical protein [Pseudomonas sp. P108]WNZ81903.1 hypothetical protein QOM10_16530 [Pseudomonas sp. P108]